MYDSFFFFFEKFRGRLFILWFFFFCLNRPTSIVSLTCLQHRSEEIKIRLEKVCLEHEFCNLTENNKLGKQ